MKINFLQANNGDSILISLKDKEDKPRNILIDGGANATYDDVIDGDGALKKAIDDIKKRKEIIDLLILSHIDNDHIEGLLKWFELDENAPKLIKEVWFNSGAFIAKYFREPRNKDLDVVIKRESTVLTGVKEGIQFEKILLENNLWNGTIIKKGDYWNIFGLEIRILTPTIKQLKKLQKEYYKVTKDPAYTASNSDWSQNISDIIAIENKSNFKFSQDGSRKNGSSITSLITHNNKNFLFLADSHPKAVSKALKDLGYSKEKPLKVDLMQVSHHGSKKNNNKELLDLIETDHYAISTNGTTHYHPHKSVLARIANKNPKATIYFNYKYILDNVLTDKDRIDFPDLKTKLTTAYNIN